MQPKATGMELFRGKPVPVRYFATGPYLEVATKVRLAHEDGGFTEVSHEFVHVGDKDVIRICIEIKGQRFYGSAQIKWGGKAADATDPVENAETSARGRALAAAGYELGHMASADAMDRVVESDGSRWVDEEPEALSAPQLALSAGHTWQSFAALLAKAANIKTKSDYLRHLQRATRKPTTVAYTTENYPRAASYFSRLASAEEARQGKLLEEHLKKGEPA